MRSHQQKTSFAPTGWSGWTSHLANERDSQPAGHHSPTNRTEGRPKRLRFNRGSEDLDFHEGVRAGKPRYDDHGHGRWHVDPHRRLLASPSIGKSSVRVRKNVVLTIWDLPIPAAESRASTLLIA
jgi:hypothetical protein